MTCDCLRELSTSTAAGSKRLDVGCARELGFTPVEVNASDTRNKADASALKGVAGKLANRVRELTTNTAIGCGADGAVKRARASGRLIRF